MSISRLRKSRGFSIAAAIVAIAVLTLVAVAVQSTIPATVYPAPLTASDQNAVPQQDAQTAAVTVTQESQLAQTVIAPQELLAPKITNAATVPGKDIVLLLLSSKSETNIRVPVCPNPPNDVAYFTPKERELITAIDRKFAGSGFGHADTPTVRCEKKPRTSPAVYIPRTDITWPQWTLYCQEKNPGSVDSAHSNGGEGVTKNLQDSDVDPIIRYLNDPKMDCRLFKPGEKPSAAAGAGTTGRVTPDPNTACVGLTDPAVCRLAINQGWESIDEARNATLTDVLKQHAEDKATYANECDVNDTDPECVADKKKIADTEAALQKLARDDAQAAANRCQGAGENYEDCIKNDPNQKAADEINKSLKENAVGLNSNGAGAQGPCPNGGVMQANGVCTAGNGAGTTCTGSSCQAGQIVSQDYYCMTSANPIVIKPVPAGTAMPSGCLNDLANQNSPYNGGNGGNGFGNPGLGANNGPQSPFGGVCNTRYVCSGNTLYYQYPTGYGGSGGQCYTQPVQQCMYGCQQTNTAANGSNGQSSIFSQIGQGLQLAASFMRLFGGGGGGSSMTSNLPSQCAMNPQYQQQQQQQQQQSPYGTGTNGQPCYQPPQQPDPSQCSNGTWRPTSAQQNGCTTGWQCVPNSPSGTTTQPTTPPTAQLSCQPQLADVGMPISFSFSCGNATASKGTGFSTDGALSGATSTPAPNPPAGSNQAAFTLTCSNLGVQATAQCQVQLNKAGIVMVTNPKTVKSGEASLIGWVTAGMKSCIVSSPDDQAFTAKNVSNTSVNGAATTSPLTTTSRFQLDCQTLAGNTRTATTSVEVK